MKIRPANESTPLPACAPAEVISPFEEKIESWRRRGSLFLGPLLGLAVWLLPLVGLA